MNNQSDPLPPTFQQTLTLIEEQYAQGQAQVQKQQFAEALATFEGCLTTAIQEETLLLVDLFADIMISIGFCYADLHEYEKALQVYHQLETVLEQGEGWYQALPERLEIGVYESYNPGFPLAAVYESIAIAYDNTNQLEKATHYYKSAITTYFELKETARAAKTWYFVGNGCRRRGDWRNLQRAG
jgi:tetratricopeptide (TPR) repeat protein